MTPLPTPDTDLARARIALGRALLAYVLLRLPQGDRYSAGMLNTVVLHLLDKVDEALYETGLAEHFAAMEQDEEEEE